MEEYEKEFDVWGNEIVDSFFTVQISHTILTKDEGEKAYCREREKETVFYQQKISELPRGTMALLVRHLNPEVPTIEELLKRPSQND